MHDILEAIAIGLLAVVAVLFAMVVVFTPIIALVNWMESSQCPARWADSGTPSVYSFWEGCRVTVDGALIPEKAFRTVAK